MARAFVSVSWDAWQREAAEAAEKRAAEMLRVYGFMFVSVKAFERADGFSFELIGAERDVRKAKALFRP